MGLWYGYIRTKLFFRLLALIHSLLHIENEVGSSLGLGRGGVDEALVILEFRKPACDIPGTLLELARNSRMGLKVTGPDLRHQLLMGIWIRTEFGHFDEVPAVQAAPVARAVDHFMEERAVVAFCRAEGALLRHVDKIQ